nr:mitochondrial n(5)-glutamine methyltransferase mtq1 [Quercus suber]
MPRIPPRLIKNTKLRDPLIYQLLPICRTVDSAQAELRWLRQYASQKAEQRSSSHSNAPLNLLHQYVNRRARGEPLQYILGSEFFGDLELRCRPGVLIPRLSAKTSPLKTAITPANDDGKLRVLDLCTGSGCIPLLFQSEFFTLTTQRHELTLTAVDLSPIALQLAAENFRLQRSTNNNLSLAARQALQTASLIHADILAPSATTALPGTDILLSNPPYISPRSFRSTTSRSVRRFEPRMALVPPPLSDSITPGPSEMLSPSPSPPTISQEDIFYPALLSHAVALDARVFWFEVADFAQATRVVEMADRFGEWDGLEIWRDWLEGESDGMGTEDVGPVSERERQTRTVTLMSGRQVEVRGEGSGRSVFGWRRNVAR